MPVGLMLADLTARVERHIIEAVFSVVPLLHVQGRKRECRRSNRTSGSFAQGCLFIIALFFLIIPAFAGFELT